MAHPSLKKKSKRLSCRTRYKIDKKVREHNRKKRREARKLKKGRKADLVVAPNLCPFKEKIIEELNEAKAKEKEMLRKNRTNDSGDGSMEVEGEALAKLVEDARNRARGFYPSLEETQKITAFEKMENASLAKEFRKVVSASDVILEVVDARDPLGTRCKVVEEAVLQHPNKRLVLVVNKADLVPRENLEAWLKYLRRNWPTVPFKASVQQQARKLGRRAMMKKSKNKKYSNTMSISLCVGAEHLMKLLGNYRRNKGISTSITVGVVGVPNVGKSSVINSLRRAKSCRVGAEPGITRTLQAVQIGANIKILDSPGIVTENPLVKNNTLSCLKNLVRADRLIDPVHAAQTILQRATKEQMMSLYNVADYSTPEDFLIVFAKRFGLLGKRGIPDPSKAARALVQDWNRGKIRFYTIPPEDNADFMISAEIVSEHAKEFEISEFNVAENNLLDVLEDTNNKKFVTYLPIVDEKMVDDSNPSELNGVVVDTSIPTKKKGKLRWKKKSKTDTKEKHNDVLILPKQKKLQKIAAKKKRKEEARLSKRQNAISDMLMESC